MWQLPEPEPMSDPQIVDRAQDLFQEYVRVVGEKHIATCGMDFENIYDVLIYPKYEIAMEKEDLGQDDDGTEILGEFLPKDNVALLSKNLFETGDPRKVFTQIHEVIGHGVLHGPFLRKNANKYSRLCTTAGTIDDGVDVFSSNVFNTFESQANTFAVSFFIPIQYLTSLYCRLARTKRQFRYTGPGRYGFYFHGRDFSRYAASPYQAAWIIAKQMEHYFWGLSTECLAYRVLEVCVDANGYTNRDFGMGSNVVSVGEHIQSVFR